MSDADIDGESSADINGESSADINGESSADINGESSASEQQPDEDMDNSESVAQEEKCVDSEQVLVEEKQTNTEEKSEEESPKPVTSDNIATSASTVHKQPSTTITFTRSPAKGSAEYREVNNITSDSHNVYPLYNYFVLLSESRS